MNVSDAEIMAAQKLLGSVCGLFGEPAGVTGTAGVKKLCEMGVLGKDDTVVTMISGNGLKDVENAIKGSRGPHLLPQRHGEPAACLCRPRRGRAIISPLPREESPSGSSLSFPPASPCNFPRPVVQSS